MSEIEQRDFVHHMNTRISQHLVTFDEAHRRFTSFIINNNRNRKYSGEAAGKRNAWLLVHPRLLQVLLYSQLGAQILQRGDHDEDEKS